MTLDLVKITSVGVGKTLRFRGIKSRGQPLNQETGLLRIRIYVTPFIYP